MDFQVVNYKLQIYFQSSRCHSKTFLLVIALDKLDLKRKSGRCLLFKFACKALDVVLYDNDFVIFVKIEKLLPLIRCHLKIFLSGFVFSCLSIIGNLAYLLH